MQRHARRGPARRSRLDAPPAGAPPALAVSSAAASSATRRGGSTTSPTPGSSSTTSSRGVEPPPPPPCPPPSPLVPGPAVRPPLGAAPSRRARRDVRPLGDAARSRTPCRVASAHLVPAADLPRRGRDLARSLPPTARASRTPRRSTGSSKSSCRGRWREPREPDRGLRRGRRRARLLAGRRADRLPLGMRGGRHPRHGRHGRIGAEGDRSRPQPVLVSRRPRARRRRREGLHPVRPRHPSRSGPCESRRASGGSSRGTTPSSRAGPRTGAGSPSGASTRRPRRATPSPSPPTALSPPRPRAVRLLDDPPVDWSAVWSPDGRSLLFSSTRGGTMNLWRIGVDPASGRPIGEPRPFTVPSSWAGPISVSAMAAGSRSRPQRPDGHPTCDVLPVAGTISGAPRTLPTGTLDVHDTVASPPTAARSSSTTPVSPSTSSSPIRWTPSPAHRGVASRPPRLLLPRRLLDCFSDRPLAGQARPSSGRTAAASTSSCPAVARASDIPSGPRTAAGWQLGSPRDRPSWRSWTGKPRGPPPLAPLGEPASLLALLVLSRRPPDRRNPPLVARETPWAAPSTAWRSAPTFAPGGRAGQLLFLPDGKRILAVSTASPRDLRPRQGISRTLVTASEGGEIGAAGLSGTAGSSRGTSVPTNRTSGSPSSREEMTIAPGVRMVPTRSPATSAKAAWARSIAPPTRS